MSIFFGKEAIMFNRRPESKQGIANFVFNALNYLTLTLFALICLYPFYYVLIYSLSSPEATGIGVYLLPKGFTLTNYVHIMASPDIARAALVTVARTVLGTVLSVISTAFFGYLMTKKELPFRSFIYRFVVMTMYISAGLIPFYILVKALGLINSFFMYIIPGLIGAFNLILVKTYVEQIPPSIEESAMVDGAGYLGIFFHLMLPLSMPIIATVAVFVAVGQWNSFSDNLIFVTDRRYTTLQLILYRILINATEATQNIKTADITKGMLKFQESPTSIRMTITMVATLPILFVYPFLQKYFVKGIMLGAIKG